LLLVLALCLLWAGGLVWFGETMPSAPAPDPRRTDAIVVLTGGRERLPVGLALLAEDKGRTLFVSGVHPEVDRPLLLRETPAPDPALADRIELGHSADNTRGNARETARWMAAKGYASLRLVTAHYHMRRSLLEFRSALPAAEIVAHPVFPAQVRSPWWRWPGTAGLVIGEYNKYLAALGRAALADLLAPIAP